MTEAVRIIKSKHDCYCSVFIIQIVLAGIFFEQFSGFLLIVCVYLIMRVTSMEHIRGQREVMHAFVRRERMERMESMGGGGGGCP